MMEPAAASMTSIVNVCRRASLVARALAIILFVAGSSVWLAPGWADDALRSAVPNFTGPVAMGGSAQFVAAALTALYSAPICIALWIAAGLFGRIERGGVFVPRTGSDLRNIGFCIFIFAAGTTIYRTLIIVVATMGNPSGQRLLVVSFDSNQPVMIVVGLLFFVLGHVMSEAARLADDHAQIV